MKRISSDPSSFFEFEKYFRATIDFEGGPNDNGSQHSLDKGGYTKYGLAIRSHPSLDLKSLSLEQAKTIYYDVYWRKARCDELPTSLMAGYFFDTCTHCGISGATKLLQRAINDQNKTKVNDVIIAIDGIIGPITLHHSKNLDLSRLRYWRVKHYFSLVQNRPSQSVFLYGWFRRALEYGL